MAPFDAHVIAADKDETINAVAEKLTAELEKDDFDVLLDDRVKASPGVKFGDAELLGCRSS